ncbi:hypothetical protein R0137_16755 [Congregibacter brevis]|uniref:Lipoprotein n=1 Tax=Congregibacter brevis TaxID=3081201 RepID=A0ABZ0ICP7_9GAMM|nr:hypothetical protein R0137_16755 [Congregibacter sp. IMCC45268]
MFDKLVMVAATTCVLSACAGRSDYQTFYHAEQGDYDAALSSAKAAQSGGFGGVEGMLFGDGGSQCREYGAVVVVHVAQGDFSGATNACQDYEEECAVVPSANLCFQYSLSELGAAQSDQAVASKLTEDAREALHFRWLMLRDDYEGRELKRPIY